jgi:hypothetical protein
MSYSNIKDAFNINYKIDETVKGLQTNYNPVVSTYANLKSSTQNLTDFTTNYEHAYDSSNDDNFCNNNCFDNESLNGTNISNLLPNKPMNNEPSQQRLTHRTCIDIYNNPSNYPESLINNAFKHITKCSLCKDEIKKIKKTDSDIIVEPNIKFDQNKNINENKNIIEPENKIILNTENKISNQVIENQLKNIQDKINEENNLKYQNAVLQNTISKYMEDVEEKKKY